MKKRDIVLIILVLICIVASFVANSLLNSSKSAKVVIYLDNKLYKELPIDEEKTIEIKKNGVLNKIHIHDNGVEMEEANCPDKVCVNTGFIDKSGQSIVCLPHKINVKIVGDEDSDMDATVN